MQDVVVKYKYPSFLVAMVYQHLHYLSDNQQRKGDADKTIPTKKIGYSSVTINV